MVQSVIASESEAISNELPIINVSPNPLTKLATIRYTVPISGKVTLKLFSATGRLVEILNDGYCNAGTYSMNLWTKTFANGVYFLRYEDRTNKSEIKLVVQ